MFRFTLISVILGFSSLCFSQTMQTPYVQSNELYSNFNMMFTKSAGAAYTEKGEYGGMFAWNPTGKDQFGNDRSDVHFDTTDRYQETFVRRQDWIVVENWSTNDGKNLDVYVIQTARAMIFINGQWNDVTDQFAGGAHPYALEKLPAQDYSLWVVADILQFRNGSAAPVAKSTYTWYVTYGAPQQVSTVFFQNQLGITQSEQYTSYNFHDFSAPVSSKAQMQAMCKGKGYACWRTNTAGTVDGAKFYWEWK
jgi:hypothetical protein